MGDSGYDVLDRQTGAKLAEVVKHHTYYNLARPLTVHYWRLWIEGSTTRDDKHYGTRTEALAALATALDGTSSWRSLPSDVDTTSLTDAEVAALRERLTHNPAAIR